MDDESVYTTNDYDKPAAFLIKTLISKGVTFPAIPRKKPDRTGFVSTATISTRKYESILRGAVKDAMGDGIEIGHSELHDMAESMINDDDIYNYLSKRYPRYSDYKLIDRLTIDLEMYAE